MRCRYAERSTEEVEYIKLTVSARAPVEKKECQHQQQCIVLTQQGGRTCFATGARVVPRPWVASGAPPPSVAEAPTLDAVTVPKLQLALGGGAGLLSLSLLLLLWCVVRARVLLTAVLLLPPVLPTRAPERWRSPSGEAAAARSGDGWDRALALASGLRSARSGFSTGLSRSLSSSLSCGGRRRVSSLPPPLFPTESLRSRTRGALPGKTKGGDAAVAAAGATSCGCCCAEGDEVVMMVAFWLLANNTWLMWLAGWTLAAMIQ